MQELEEITISLDRDAARAYRAASSEEQKKIQMIIGEWLKDITRKDPNSLKRIMDQLSDKAEARGLTEEILDSILSEN